MLPYTMDKQDNGTIMIHRLIIIGAGAAGLYAGAVVKSAEGVLILEKGSRAGQKLLLTGNGQCNLTHGGNIKDFVGHYGQNGNRIRTTLYRHSNRSVLESFENMGIQTLEREDGKIFPSSFDARDVVNALTCQCKKNGIPIVYSSPAVALERTGDHFTVICPNQRYESQSVLVATGGCSYPSTGSDGGFFKLLEDLGVKVTERRPALTPVYVFGYPYASCSGITFKNAKLSIMKNLHTDHSKETSVEFSGSLLLTHQGFSGPLILDHSRYLSAGDRIRLNYNPGISEVQLAAKAKKAAANSKKQWITVLTELFGEGEDGAFSELPKRFLETLCERCGIDPAVKAAQMPRSDMERIIKNILRDEFTVEKLGSLRSAMVTAGGVSLDEVDLKTMESKRVPGLYFAGEVLDVDGDTGGYNLQFAFSSAYSAVNA